ncbi:glutamate racemase [Aerococcaceae bacterium NML190073]|nr:glutamate racemase [Aerococcaceae bacterium NML190073]MCW6665108.1 glutamate racemase [Aerococcaceae bacterium NML191219]
MKHLPIGFIDSGFGGLTVVKQSLKQLPNESVIYLGDSARCPYGPRPLEEVKAYIWQLTRFLLEKGIKMLVIACNTGTAAALDEIRATLDIPVVGVIHPGSRAAIKQTQNHRIGIIGTQGTVNSELYEHVLLEKASHLQVTSVACPKFVQIVEANRMDSVETPAVIQQQLADFHGSGVDTLILGCTHYPLLKRQIKAVMGPDVTLIDSGVETINEVSTLLDYFKLSRTADDARQVPPVHRFYTTGEVDSFAKFVMEWLNIDDIQIHNCIIKEDTIIETNHCKPE